MLFRSAYVLINTAVSWAGSCALYYDNTTNSVYMNQGTGSSFTGPMTVGTAGTLQSSQCTLDVGASSVSKSGNDLTVNLALTFSPSFAGSKTVFMYVEDQDGLNSATWQARGSWTVPNPTPAIASIAPATVNVGSPDTSLTVNGSGFSSQSTVKLGSTKIGRAHV